ncbi:uncharacterized protein A4U43_C06F10250 [Asparagus officinalis]|uniref:Glycosyltransferase n=1 Tax=Asparagus officinalis TaxID=4686 RepID=A0A5P1ERH7_ASPOF|nr:putative UDP-rhamnose:rhamnosyltransferase 1 [Asparagus officinalis]ONK66620.1 uncharacterized protein A4U43_C06F10250 [Asparagus officinalis]
MASLRSHAPIPRALQSLSRKRPQNLLHHHPKKPPKTPQTPLTALRPHRPHPSPSPADQGPARGRRGHGRPPARRSPVPQESPRLSRATLSPIHRTGLPKARLDSSGLHPALDTRNRRRGRRADHPSVHFLDGLLRLQWTIPFPSNLCYRLHEARRLFSDSFTSNASGISDFQRIKLVLDGCKAVAIRSSMELEPEWLELLPKLYDKPVIPIGLLPPPTTTMEGSRGSGGNDILDWLSEQRSRSVVFVALGTEVALSSEMLHQLALGLEISKVPFVWAFRKPAGSLNHEGLLPEGFEERCKRYGIVARGWVPQLKILAHESVGGFLTHCGWGSVVESLHFGLPLVMLPISVDQGINARMIIEKGISVEIERNEEDGSFTKEAVAKALRGVVVEGEKYRKRAGGLKDVFTDKDRQEKYVNAFVRYLHEL